MGGSEIGDVRGVAHLIEKVIRQMNGVREPTPDKLAFAVLSS